MAEYKEIHGTKIRNYTTNPDNPITGEVWYNDTDNVLKFSHPAVTTTGSWATGGNLNAPAGKALSAGAGTKSAAIVFGGDDDSGPTVVGNTELYNGANWTEVNNMNTARKNFPGAGTQTAAIGMSGSPNGSTIVTDTETWNGTNWTEVNDMNTGRRYMSGSGLANTSVLVYGGYAPSPGAPGYAITESWNGTNWTEVNDLNKSRFYGGGAGADNTSALYFGGDQGESFSPEDYGGCELYNGTNWTEVNDLNTARSGLGGSGIATSGVAYGGSNPSPRTGRTEVWNGTNWTEDGDMNEARSSMASLGTSKSEALAAGGYPPGPVSASTEEWTGPGTPIGGWSTGSDLNTARRTFAGAGENSSSGLAFGGTSSPGSEVGNTEAYNGTNWTELNDMTTGRAILAGDGTQTSALAFGGNPITGKTESWNGTNWTEVNDLNTSRYGL
jgi:hypothetical protein